MTAGICAAIATFEVLLSFGRFRMTEALVVAALATGAARLLTGVRAMRVLHLLGGDLAALSRFLLGARPWLWPLRVALVGAAGNVVARG